MSKPPLTKKRTTDSSEAGDLAERTYRPSVDILEGPDGVTLFADMPGVREEDIDIEIADGTLSILGKVRNRQEPETRFLRREYDSGNFSCSFQVAETTDANAIRAELKQGVLTVQLPKSEAARPRRIAVEST